MTKDKLVNRLSRGERPGVTSTEEWAQLFSSRQQSRIQEVHRVIQDEVSAGRLVLKATGETHIRLPMFLIGRVRLDWYGSPEERRQRFADSRPAFATPPPTNIDPVMGFDESDAKQLRPILRLLGLWPESLDELPIFKDNQSRSVAEQPSGSEQLKLRLIGKGSIDGPRGTSIDFSTVLENVKLKAFARANEIVPAMWYESKVRQWLVDNSYKLNFQAIHSQSPSDAESEQKSGANPPHRPFGVIKAVENG